MGDMHFFPPIVQKKKKKKLKREKKRFFLCECFKRCDVGGCAHYFWYDITVLIELNAIYS